MTKLILFLAAVIGVIGGMTAGWRGGVIWFVGVLAVVILVRKNWRRADARKEAEAMRSAEEEG